MNQQYDLHDLTYKKVLVVGIARSGASVARLLVEKGAAVTMTDRKTAEELAETLAGLPPDKVKIIAGVHPEFCREDYDFLVVSPGVPLSAPPLQRAFRLGLPVLGELELAFQFAKSPIIAITGTNGKTTTTSLIGEIFREAGRKVLVGGNIGLPLAAEVEKYGPGDLIVAEVSSFQLETVAAFRPKVAVLLNLTPDHLDRHGTMENYLDAKAEIFARQDAGDFTILNYDDPQIASLKERTPGRVIFFSRKHKLEEGIYVEQDLIVANFGGKTEPVCHVREVLIKGAHNLENALAAAAAGYVLGVPAARIGKTLQTFAGVPHRLEPVAEINGVRYLNDSKGTNPDASIKALEAYDDPIVLIAGGRNKGNDFSEFAQKVRERVRSLVLLGECRDEIKNAVEKAGFNKVTMAASLEEAVDMAAAEAGPGEIVLLSPACASWDMFKDFEERGERFKQAVLNLRR